MKLLVAYDGSEFSDAAIVDLRRAGLPAAAEALVLSVTESQSAAATPYVAIAAGLGGYPPADQDSDGYELQNTKAMATQAAERLRADFPGWQISTETWIDSPAEAIVRKAYGWKPDLIIVGSHGHSGISRLVLGSVSQHVLHHTDCSVRISRHHLHSQDRSIRLLIGVDDSNEAKTAIACIASRNWPAGTEARVVGVVDMQSSLAVTVMAEGVIPGVLEEEVRKRLSKFAHEAVQQLTNAGLRASPQILAGRPAHALTKEADDWSADCIFVGAKCHHGLERVLLGSVSNAVASHAHCSVEIVRAHVE